MNAFKRSLGGVMISIADLIIGILLLVNPVGFTSVIIIAAGILLMLFGLGSIVRYFRTEPEEAAVGQMLVKGLIMLLGGVFCAFCSQWFIVTFPVLTLLYGVAVLVGGLTKLQWTVDILRLKRRRWLPAAISAAISLLCGSVIIANPFSSTAVLWMFVGISLIVEAALDLFAALFGNKERQTAEE